MATDLLLDLFLDFSTCDLCDAYRADMQGELRVFPPVFRDFGQHQKFYGVVETLQCFEDNTSVKSVLEQPGRMDSEFASLAKVLLVDGAASLRRALLGGNLGAAAVRNGWAGVVVNGCVRDVAELARLPLGVRALAAMPLPTEKRHAGLHQVPVHIQGVWAHPGDWLFADEDGVVLLSPGQGRQYYAKQRNGKSE